MALNLEDGMDKIADLIGQLGSPDKNKRFDACEELRVSNYLPAEAIAALQSATRDPDERVAERARLAFAAHRLSGDIATRPLIVSSGADSAERSHTPASTIQPTAIRNWFDPTRLYNPTVRGGRLVFLWGLAVYPLIAIIVLIGITDGISSYSGQLISLEERLWEVALLVASVMMILRRLRDLGKSGWTVLLGLIPLVNLFFLLYLLVSPGIREPVQAIAAGPQASHT
jgi:uncharacterized membrane protein YhaH (DUF805 family)